MSRYNQRSILYHRVDVLDRDEDEYVLGGLDPVSSSQSDAAFQRQDATVAYKFPRMLATIACMLWFIVALLLLLTPWFDNTATNNPSIVVDTTTATMVLAYAIVCLSITVLSIVVLSCCVHHASLLHAGVVALHISAMLCMIGGICVCLFVNTRFFLVSGSPIPFSAITGIAPAPTSAVLINTPWLQVLLATSILLPLGIIHACLRTAWVQRDDIYSVTIVCACMLQIVASIGAVYLIIVYWTMVSAAVALAAWGCLFLFITAVVQVTLCFYAMCVMNTPYTIDRYLRWSLSCSVASTVCGIIVMQSALSATPFDAAQHLQLIIATLVTYSQPLVFTTLMAAAHWKENILFE